MTTFVGILNFINDHKPSANICVSCFIKLIKDWCLKCQKYPEGNWKFHALFPYFFDKRLFLRKYWEKNIESKKVRLKFIIVLHHPHYIASQINTQITRLIFSLLYPPATKWFISSVRRCEWEENFCCFCEREKNWNSFSPKWCWSMVMVQFLSKTFLESRWWPLVLV